MPLLSALLGENPNSRDQMAAILAQQVYGGNDPNLEDPQWAALQRHPYAMQMAGQMAPSFDSSGTTGGQGPNTSATGPVPSENPIETAVQGPSNPNGPPPTVDIPDAPPPPGAPPQNPAITEYEINDIMSQPGSIPGNPAVADFPESVLGGSSQQGVSATTPGFNSNVPGFSNTSVPGFTNSLGTPGNPLGTSPPGIVGQQTSLQDLLEANPEAFAAYAAASKGGVGYEGAVQAALSAMQGGIPAYGAIYGDPFGELGAFGPEAYGFSSAAAQDAWGAAYADAIAAGLDDAAAAAAADDAVGGFGGDEGPDGGGDGPDGGGDDE